MLLRDVLGRIFWDQRERPEDYEVKFIHRGSHMDLKSISCQQIAEVKTSYITYEDGEVLIPLHRIVEVRNIRNDCVLWRKKGYTDRNQKKSSKLNLSDDVRK